MCGLYRAGRIAEKLSAIARVAEARDLAAMQQASIEALYPGGWAQLKLGWSASLSSFRAQASGFYDAAVSTARYVDGPITDPADGSDCRVAALALITARPNSAHARTLASAAAIRGGDLGRAYICSM